MTETQAPKTIPANQLEAKTAQLLQKRAQLAEKGVAVCGKCNKVGPVNQTLMIVYLNNILVSVCPACVKGQRIVTEVREDGNISVQAEDRAASAIIPAASMASVPSLAKVLAPEIVKKELG